MLHTAALEAPRPNTPEMSFYLDDSRVNVPVSDAMAFLAQHDSFRVFVGFVHPATNCYIDGYLTLYPKPQKTFVRGLGGWCFLTEWQGIMIRLPADMAWWSQRQGSLDMAQEITYVHRGEIKRATIEINVGRAIRIPQTDD